MSDPQFHVNDRVRMRAKTSESGLVIAAPRALAGQWCYRVAFAGGESTFGEGDLEPAPAGQDPRSLFCSRSFADREACLLHLTFLRLSTNLSNYLYSFDNSRTTFYVHQFKPLVKFLDGAGRVLIADEVGLGKTIEAGFILLELEARRRLDRALIVCPANLREKWRRELLTRFELDFEIVRVADLGQRIRECERGIKTEFRVIVSYETIRAAQDMIASNSSGSCERRTRRRRSSSSRTSAGRSSTSPNASSAPAFRTSSSTEALVRRRDAGRVWLTAFGIARRTPQPPRPPAAQRSKNASSPNSMSAACCSSNG